jgi:hypothetical protein
MHMHMDYASQLWSPVARPGDLAAQEAPLRAFTKKITGLHTTQYWERLSALQMHSTERRQERYRIIYTWKALSGVVPDFGLELSPASGRRGPLLRIPATKGSAAVGTLRGSSLQVEGPRLFNCLPASLRNLKVDPVIFKVALDLFLKEVPDHPDGGDARPEATTPEGRPSNSLKDWMRWDRALDSWTLPKELIQLYPSLCPQQLSTGPPSSSSTDSPVAPVT